jgi:hypothetical protein
MVSIQRDKILHNLRSGRANIQSQAFADLCALTGDLHLLFDFARNVCLWGGNGAQNRRITLTAARLIIGRTSTADLIFYDPKVSRQHLAIFPTNTNEGTLIAEDLSSASGTLLNGERLRRSELNDLDTLQVGARKIHIHLLRANRTVFLS